MSRSKILALILAGGKGSRLGVLTEERAKPAMPFAGVYRLIDFALSNCKHSEISDVWVIEQYQPHSLNDHLANGRPWDLDRTYGGLQVLPPFEVGDENSDDGGFAQGNADAIYRHKDYIRDFDPDILLVLSADHIYKLDYRDVIEQHEARGSDVTIVTTEVPIAEASRFGVVRARSDSRITHFDYKPDKPQSRTVTTEVFVYNARVLMDTLDRLASENKKKAKNSDAKKTKDAANQSSDKTDTKSNKNPKGDESDNNESPTLRDFGHELIPALVRDGKAHEFRLEGYWRDVGTIESYWLAHAELLAERPALKLDDARWPILTYGTQLLPARIHKSARIENSFISPGCTVRGQVIRSVLAPDVVIEAGAIVKDSIVLRGSVIGADARVANAILDEHVRVGERARVGKQQISGRMKTERDLSEHITLVRRASRIAPKTKRMPKD